VLIGRDLGLSGRRHDDRGLVCRRRKRRRRGAEPGRCQQPSQDMSHFRFPARSARDRAMTITILGSLTAATAADRRSC
jgi:hypothetical protein